MTILWSSNPSVRLSSAAPEACAALQLGEDLTVPSHQRDQRPGRRRVRPHLVGVREEVTLERGARKPQLGGERGIGRLHHQLGPSRDAGGGEEVGDLDQVLSLGHHHRHQLVGGPLHQRVEDLLGRGGRDQVVAPGLEPTGHAALARVEPEHDGIADEPGGRQPIGDVAGARPGGDVDRDLPLRRAAGRVAVAPGGAGDERQHHQAHDAGQDKDDQRPFHRFLHLL